MRKAVNEDIQGGDDDGKEEFPSYFQNVDGMEGPTPQTPWAANLSFNDLKTLMNNLYIEADRVYPKNGWVGPVERSKPATEVLKHNLRYWTFPCQRRITHRWDKALRSFRKSSLLFHAATGKATILQEDVAMGAPMATLGDRDPEDVYVIVARSSEREGAQGPFLPRHSTYHGTPSAPGQGRRHDASRRGRSNSRTRPFARPHYSQFDRRYTDRSAPGLGKGLGSGSPKTQPKNQNQPKPKTQNLNHLNLVKHNKSLDKYFHPNNFNTLKTSTTSSSS